MKERVNHPTYYNTHPSGRECIEIIRHYVCDIANVFKYLWRAGLKQEAGISDKQKEIEDCKKAIWYLNDYLHDAIEGSEYRSEWQKHPSGVDCDAIASFYSPRIAQVFRELWWVGLVVNGYLLKDKDEKVKVRNAIEYIKLHISQLENNS